MPPLAELQTRMRRAVAGGDTASIASVLVGGGQPERRLTIHRRHYETSLVNALLQKFPATAWLVGTPLLTVAALRFVRVHPPAKPCIAEYGEGFPEFLATMPEGQNLPYIRSFTELEWHLGQIAVATDGPAVKLADLTSFDIDQLPDLRLRCQSGLRYLMTDWPVDKLIKLFLSNSAPDSLALNRERLRLELRGSRGEFSISRLSADEFTFRGSIAAGVAVGLAAQTALQVNAAFDLAAAFSGLLTDGLVTAVSVAEGHSNGGHATLAG
jgi:Putative DNA-binding domain